MRRRKLITIILTLALFITLMPVYTSAAGYLPSLEEKSMYYTPDYRSGDCILSSTKSMMRRAAIARNSYSWDKITNTSLRGSATTRGLLRNNFNYTCDGIKYTVQVHSLTGNSEKKIKDITSLLKSHPEGIVVWGKGAATTGTHGILVTDSIDGKLYGVDSTHNTRKMNVGIEPWENTTMKSINYCTNVWFISSISGGAGAGPSGPSTLNAAAVREPEQIKQGNGFTIFGVVTSNYRINNVTVSIVDAAGNDVITKTATPNGGIYLIANLDSSVKFGTLKTGRYTYRIAATDAKKGYAVLHENVFTVVPKKGAKAQAGTAAVSSGNVSVSSLRAPSSVRKGRSFSIRGKLKASQKIREVSVQVLDRSGNAVLSATSKPNSKSYNIRKLDSKIRFGRLSKGDYVFAVKARTDSGLETPVYRDFSVR